MDRDDWFMYGLIGGLIVCGPFIGAYYGVRWLYNQTPKQKRERKRKEEEKERLDKEIRCIEEKLGLVGRSDSICHYDPFYYKNRYNNTIVR